MGRLRRRRQGRSFVGFGLLGVLFGLIGVVIAGSVERKFNPCTPYAR